MQITSILAFGLAGTALASPLYPRDGPAISDASAKIQSALTDLDNFVLSLTADQVQAQSAELTQKANTVSDALNAGAEAVKASPPDSDIGTAVSNLLVAAPLALQGVTVVTDIVQKKEILKGAGLTDQVVEQLNSNKQATGNFVNALIGSMPAISGLLSGIGLSDTSVIVNSIFDVGIQQFQSDAPPPDVSASGGSTAAGLGALAGAFGLSGTGTGGAGGASSAAGLGSLLGSLGGATGGASGLGALSGLAGLGGSSSSNPLAGLLGGLGGSRGGTSTSNPLAGLLGGSSSSNPLAGLLGGLGGSGTSASGLGSLLGGLRPPTATATV